MATTINKQLLTDEYIINILLPKLFNDGSKVPKRLFDITYEELINTFGGYSINKDVIGAWKDPNTNIIYHDTNINISILTNKYDELILSNLCNTLKERFNQLSIYMTISTIKAVNN